MFSSNERISEKQMLKMVASSLFLSGLFFIPYFSVRLFGENIFPGLFIFLIFTGLLFFYFYRVGEYRKKENNPVILKIQIIRLMIRLVFYILFSIEILEEVQVPFVQPDRDNSWRNILVILPLLLIALYGANISYIRYKLENRNEKKCTKGNENSKVKYIGIEKQGRLREMLFRSLYIPYLIMLFLGLKEVDFSIFLPKMTISLGKMIFYAYALLTFIMPLENYVWLHPFLCKEMNLEEKAVLKRKEKWKKLSFVMIYGTLFLVVFITLILVGIYGVSGGRKEEMLSIAIMRYIRFPFGILERFDVIMDWFFIVGSFVLICETLYFMGELLSRLIKNRKRIWILVGILVFLIIMLLCIPEYKNILSIYVYYGIFIDIPLAIILPALGNHLSKSKKQENLNDV